MQELTVQQHDCGSFSVSTMTACSALPTSLHSLRLRGADINIRDAQELLGLVPQHGQRYGSGTFRLDIEVRSCANHAP